MPLREEQKDEKSRKTRRAERREEQKDEKSRKTRRAERREEQKDEKKGGGGIEHQSTQIPREPAAHQEKSSRTVRYPRVRNAWADPTQTFVLSLYITIPPSGPETFAARKKPHPHPTKHHNPRILRWIASITIIQPIKSVLS
jgi:hypothetical protein